jgi:hypothetical protein
VLLTIPATNDRIVVRKLDVEAALKKSPLAYLFVTSLLGRHADKGTAYDDQMAVKSKKGKVEYRLDSGPKGMSLGKTVCVETTVARFSMATVCSNPCAASGGHTARVDSRFPTR